MFESPPTTVNPRHPLWLTIIQPITACLAPPVCALCRAPGQPLDEPWGLDLCAQCAAACRRAPAEALPFDAALCLFEYREPVDQMITRLKFQHELVFARVLGMLFARTIRSAARPLPDCLVPLPLHRDRYRERGFCQTTEIARHLARRLRDPRGHPLPVRAGLLQRIRATRAQSGLNAVERVGNLHGAFASPVSHRPPRRSGMTFASASNMPGRLLTVRNLPPLNTFSPPVPATHRAWPSCTILVTTPTDNPCAAPYTVRVPPAMLTSWLFM